MAYLPMNAIAHTLHMACINKITSCQKRADTSGVGKSNNYYEDIYIQWNLIITVTLGPNLSGCYIEVAFLLSGIQNHHN